jgi:DNA ligase-1
MLAATQDSEDLSNIVYPAYCTRKLDGIRAEFLDGSIKSRKLKKIPNKYISNELDKIFNNCSKNGRKFLGEFDGEIIASKTMNFQETTHNVMSFDGEPDFVFYVFDIVENSLTTSYENRMELLKQIEFNDPRIVKLIPTKINNEKELLEFEEQCLTTGFEGVIGRSGNGPYKCGRSTPNQGYLWKMKRFSDSEAVITSLEELTENTAVSNVNALGLKEKTHRKNDMVGKNTLGTIIAIDVFSDNEVRVGSGLNDVMRNEIWSNQANYIGKTIKYKYFKIGMKEDGKGRHPVFIGFRDTEID